MTVEEIFEQSAARFAAKSVAYQPAEYRNRFTGKRHVVLERTCCCDRCLRKVESAA